MNPRIAVPILIGFWVWGATPMVNLAQTRSQSAPPPTEPIPVPIDAIHRDLVQQLSAEQIQVLSQDYPEFRLLALCPSFTAADQKQWVLGLWQPGSSAQSQAGTVHRVGLIDNPAGW
jgi:hypothetical protein